MVWDSPQTTRAVRHGSRAPLEQAPRSNNGAPPQHVNQSNSKPWNPPKCPSGRDRFFRGAMGTGSAGPEGRREGCET